MQEALAWCSHYYKLNPYKEASSHEAICMRLVGFRRSGFSVHYMTPRYEIDACRIDLCIHIVILTHLFYVNLTPTNIVWNWGTPYLSILGSMQCFHSQFCYVQWSIRWLFWQAWAETEGGILRAFMSYCLARFQRNQNSRLNMCVSLPVVPHKAVAEVSR